MIATKDKESIDKLIKYIEQEYSTEMLEDISFKITTLIYEREEFERGLGDS